MSAICQVSAAPAEGIGRAPLDARRAAGCPVRWGAGIWGPTGRERFWKNVRTKRTKRTKSAPAPRGPEGADVWRGAGAGSAEAWGIFSGRQTRVLPWGAGVGAVYRMVTCLRSRLRTFPLADSKNIFGVLAPGAGGGLRVRENALNEGHQASHTKKPIDEGFRGCGKRSNRERRPCPQWLKPDIITSTYGRPEGRPLQNQKQRHSLAFRLGFGKVAK
jgi:hypothetical protein